MVPSCGIVFTHIEPLSGKFLESLSNYWILKEDFAYVISLLSMSKIASGMCTFINAEWTV